MPEYAIHHQAFGINFNHADHFKKAVVCVCLSGDWRCQDAIFNLEWLAVKVYSSDDPDGLMAVVASATQINLNWNDNSTDETAFSLERSEDGGTNWQEIAVLDPDTITYTNTGLTCGTAYDYRLRAYRAENAFYSDYCAVESSPSGACTAQTVGEYDDTHTVLVYSGTWTSESDAGAYYWTRSHSQIEGSKLTITTDTSCFTLLYTGTAGGAEVDVYLDRRRIIGYD